VIKRGENCWQPGRVTPTKSIAASHSFRTKSKHDTQKETRKLAQDYISGSMNVLSATSNTNGGFDEIT